MAGSIHKLVIRREEKKAYTCFRDLKLYRTNYGYLRDMLYRGHIHRNKKVNGRLVFAFRQKNNVISSRRKSLQCYNNILYNLNLRTASFLCNYARTDKIHMSLFIA